MDRASVGDVLGASAEPAVVRHGERTYRCGAPTQAAKDRLEKMVAGAAMAEVRNLKASLPNDAYAELWKDCCDGIKAREHATGGALWVRTLTTADGALFFPLSLFQENHPTMTVEEFRALAMAEPEQVEAAISLMVPRFFVLLGQSMGADPAQVQAVLERLPLRKPSATIP